MENRKIAIFLGAHKPWSKELTKQVDLFCEKHNAVVFMDHTSNYLGKYGVLMNIISGQTNYRSECISVDLLIDLGEVAGAYKGIVLKRGWRVNSDGIIRDAYLCLRYIFEMEEEQFFTL